MSKESELTIFEETPGTWLAKLTIGALVWEERHDRPYQALRGLLDVDTFYVFDVGVMLLVMDALDKYLAEKFAMSDPIQPGIPGPPEPGEGVLVPEYERDDKVWMIMPETGDRQGGVVTDVRISNGTVWCDVQPDNGSIIRGIQQVNLEHRTPPEPGEAS